MSIRDKFVKSFGEEQAKNIEKASLEHINGVNSKNKGSDPFKWSLLICIGYECMEKERYRKHHNIKPAFSKLKKWIRDNAELGSHNGDCDYIALAAGAYKPFVKLTSTPPEQKKEGR